MKILIVVDMQNDFITGSLGSKEALKIVASVENKVKNFKETIIFTRDTHYSNYLSTQEGRKLPVPHCIINTEGWQICDKLKPYAKNICNKETFGYYELPKYIKSLVNIDDVDEIILCGLCTDICVISNAFILKSAFPEIKISVDANCSAGVTKESHINAINALKAVQVDIIE